MQARKGHNSLERRVIENPSLARLSDCGHVNQGFDTLGHIEPSLFYVDDTSKWMDSGRRSTSSLNKTYPRFTESWLQLESAYGDSSKTNGSKRTGKCSCCSKSCLKATIISILVLCLLGFAAIISGILYIEVFSAEAREARNKGGADTKNQTIGPLMSTTFLPTVYSNATEASGSSSAPSSAGMDVKITTSSESPSSTVIVDLGTSESITTQLNGSITPSVYPTNETTVG